MNTLIHADIFFFITTICIVVLTILAIVAWIYIIKILANVKKLTDKARIEGEFIIEELGDLRERLHTQSFGARALFRFVRRLISRYN
ncbi:MAG: hypothetical protein JWO00_581 [Candidatus Parcubacteria bacterium]|nr:hypothetical protein [Candidatus Parcubacteria bacterium]